ncbi:MAG: cation transporter [Acidobacteria bacterium]|nr:cation transporter [Acidobacteriota bacterium]
MAHTHRHDGHGARDGSPRRRLAIALVLATGYMAAEVVGGLLSNSLALLADATHMLSDVAALSLSLFAVWFARRPPTARRTYGYHRVEILATLLNAATLLATAVFIFLEALRRFAAPPAVNGTLMTVIATGGLAVNLAMLAVLRGGRETSLNLRGAWLHVLTDTLGSVQAIAAGALLMAFGWRWVDPLASLLISLLVLYSGWGLLREATAILMESVPADIELEDVREAILAVPGIEGLHDLHVWTITTGFVALSAHVTVRDGDQAEVLAAARQCVHARFGISHSTIQVEQAAVASPCSTCPSPPLP